MLRQLEIVNSICLSIVILTVCCTCIHSFTITRINVLCSSCCSDCTITGVTSECNKNEQQSNFRTLTFYEHLHVIVNSSEKNRSQQIMLRQLEIVNSICLSIVILTVCCTCIHSFTITRINMLCSSCCSDCTITGVTSECNKNEQHIYLSSLNVQCCRHTQRFLFSLLECMLIIQLFVYKYNKVYFKTCYTVC